MHHNKAVGWYNRCDVGFFFMSFFSQQENREFSMKPKETE
jgi:hypothetical protein